METGQQLFEARQRRGLTLEDISRSTKIPISLLHAIERNDTARLPQEFFARALVRAYAKEVGIAPDALVPIAEAEQNPAQRLSANAPTDDRTSSGSFVGVVALCAACAVYSGFASKPGEPTTAEVVPAAAAHSSTANTVAAEAPPPCVAVPPSPTTVRAAHRTTASASATSEAAVAAGTTAAPVVTNVTSDDRPLNEPAADSPALISEPVSAPPVDQANPGPAPAEQL